MSPSVAAACARGQLRRLHAGRVLLAEKEQQLQRRLASATQDEEVRRFTRGAGLADVGTVLGIAGDPPAMHALGERRHDSHCLGIARRSGCRALPDGTWRLPSGRVLADLGAIPGAMRELSARRAAIREVVGASRLEVIDAARAVHRSLTHAPQSGGANPRPRPHNER